MSAENDTDGPSDQQEIGGSGGAGDGGGAGRAESIGSQAKTVTRKNDCAACMHQRRSCPVDCPFAPFFPKYRKQDFLNCQKVFGVKKLKEMINQVDPSLKEDTVKSLVYEANARVNDPVGGCVAITHILQREVGMCESELASVNNNLAICRSQMDLGAFNLPDGAQVAAEGGDFAEYVEFNTREDESTERTGHNSRNSEHNSSYKNQQ